MWLFDFFVALIFVGSAAYTLQVKLADEGIPDAKQITWSIVICFAAYLLSLILAIPFLDRLARIPSWLWIGLVGSSLLAFGNAIRALVFVSPEPSSSGLIIDGLRLIIFGLIFLSIPTLIVLIVVRVLLLSVWAAYYSIHKKLR
jgi:hypothetical protein